MSLLTAPTATAAPRASGRGLGVALALTVAAAALLVHARLPVLPAALVAVVAGSVAASAGALPEASLPGLTWTSRTVLRWAVVLLGLSLPLRAVLALGPGALVLAATVVVGGVLCTLALGRVLGVSRQRSLLIACGSSICGAAAVAAARDGLGGDDDDAAAAVGVVVGYGSLLMIALPATLHLLGVAPATSGLVVGASVHEVAQVVAAGSLLGGGALSVAVLVKLARVLLLAPTVLALSLLGRRHAVPGAVRPPLLPWFVVGFAALVLVRSLIPVPAEVLDVVAWGQTLLMTAALFALGSGLTPQLLRRVGRRPVLLGGAATLVVLTLAAAGGATITAI